MDVSSKEFDTKKYPHHLAILDAITTKNIPFVPKTITVSWASISEVSYHFTDAQDNESWITFNLITGEINMDDVVICKKGGTCDVTI